MSGKNVFVFVVCGADEHIATLNFSLKQLKQFTKSPIVVVTDTSRNQSVIKHDHIIDISTPSSFDHHQASIYLKTGLHKFLDLTDNYCYLDSDVIALNTKVDEIFNHNYGPVTFGPDHCRIHSFSPYAMNCGCLERKKTIQKEFVDTIKKIIPEYNHNNYIHTENGRELIRILAKIGQNPLKKIHMSVNFLMEKHLLKRKTRITQWGGGMKYSSAKKGWKDMGGNVVMHNITAVSKKIKAISSFSFNKHGQFWVDNYGDRFLFIECDHLKERIREKFNIEILHKDFQHWNGGVFLFNKDSMDFMEAWHQHTLDIFKDKDWKTRDQGTLAATVWQFGLQDQKMLPIRFNFIADYYNPAIGFRSDKGFTKDNFKTVIVPIFIHVYHEFGNRNWDIWQGIEKIISTGTKS